MSTYYTPRAGLRNAASYQSSGAPFVTGSDNLNGVMKIEFPFVTKEISIHVESGKEVDFYFHTDATSFNKFFIDNTTHDHGPVTIDVKCKEIYIETSSTTKFRVYASLTNIDTSHMYELTGSGITE